MNLGIPQVSPRLGDHNGGLVGAPAHNAGEQRHGVGLDSVGDDFALVAADFFEALVFGPGTGWDL